MDAVEYYSRAFDAIFQPKDNPARVATPTEYLKAEEDERAEFNQLSAPAQRLAILDYIAKHSYDNGLIGEAVNEHKLAGKFAAAFALGDTAEMGRLVDQMIREYVGNSVPQDWDREAA